MLTQEEMALAETRAIEAIKSYRCRVGVTLAEAKKEVDRYRFDPASYMSNCVGAIADLIMTEAGVCETLNAQVLVKRAPQEDEVRRLYANRSRLRAYIISNLSSFQKGIESLQKGSTD